MKKLLLILLCLPFIGFGQNVYIPDANFKAYLVANSAINTNGDSEIQVSEANSFNAFLSVGFQGITDLTGIEFFTSLTGLDCESNQLTFLDLSNNTDLWFLECSNNQLVSLDIYNNPLLQSLYGRNNQLLNLNLTNNTNLCCLELTNNQIISLDLRNGNNYNLNDLDLSDNSSLTCINVDDSTWSANNTAAGHWDIDPQHYFSNNCSGATNIQEYSTNKELLKVTDLLTRETNKTNKSTSTLLIR